MNDGAVAKHKDNAETTGNSTTTAENESMPGTSAGDFSYRGDTGHQQQQAYAYVSTAEQIDVFLLV